MKTEECKGSLYVLSQTAVQRFMDQVYAVYNTDYSEIQAIFECPYCGHSMFMLIFNPYGDGSVVELALPRHDTKGRRIWQPGESLQVNETFTLAT